MVEVAGAKHARDRADIAAEIGASSVAVVVPCFREEAKIAATLASIPAFVTRIYVVDDTSPDRSAEIVANAALTDPRIVLIRHEKNQGVGAAISTGYLRCLADGIDFAVVMAGDGQMDPVDLPALLQPALRDEADYVKGNRFFHAVGLAPFPRHRLFGNVGLSILTKIVSGYWHVSDTQCGYTVINRRALAAIDWHGVYPRYGCPNDMLTKLNVANMRVAEVSVHPRYGNDWTSSMKVSRIVWPMLKLLWRLFRYRIYYKYVVLNGHPIVLFYAFGMLSAILSTILFIYLIVKFAITGVVPQAALIMYGITLGASLQMLLGGFTLDYQANQHLMVNLSAKQQPGA
jgi:glycosyltransferase involved in cell wall biosynthesis